MAHALPLGGDGRRAVRRAARRRRPGRAAKSGRVVPRIPAGAGAARGALLVAARRSGARTTPCSRRGSEGCRRRCPCSRRRRGTSTMPATLPVDVRARRRGAPGAGGVRHAGRSRARSSRGWRRSPTSTCTACCGSARTCWASPRRRPSWPTGVTARTCRRTRRSSARSRWSRRWRSRLSTRPSPRWPSPGRRARSARRTSRRPARSPTCGRCALRGRRRPSRLRPAAPPASARAWTSSCSQASTPSTRTTCTRCGDTWPTRRTRRRRSRSSACVRLSPRALSELPALAEPYVVALVASGRMRGAVQTAAAEGVAPRGRGSSHARGAPSWRCASRPRAVSARRTSSPPRPSRRS